MITPMKKIILAGRLADRESVLLTLREAGVVHVEPVYPELVRVSSDLLKEIERAARATEVLTKLTPPPDAAHPSESPARLSEEINEHLAQLSKLRADKMDIEKEVERVAPWGHIEKADMEAIRQSGLDVGFFTCPEGSEETIEANVRRLVTKKNGTSYVIAVSRNPIPPSPKATRISQPPRDVVELESALKDIAEEETRIQNTLQKLAGCRNDLTTYHEELLAKKKFSEVETSLIHEGPVFVLKGWIPDESVQGLEQTFAKSSLHVGIRLLEPTDEELPPTKLKNPWWCKPIECLYPLLGITPGYRETDITPFFLPFLTIFTAMLFADAGYGLVCLIALLIAYKPLVSKGAPKELIKLFIILFSGVVAYGVYTNAYFGMVLKLTPFDSSSPEGEYMLKKACFFIGAVHITLAHIWKIRKNPIDLTLLSEVGWTLFIWAMYSLVTVLVLGDPAPAWMLPMFGVSLGLVLFFTSPRWNILACVGSGLGAIALSAAGFLSDIISYIRLWAVGLAGGILAASFNELASPLPIVLAVVILVAAHFMNIALCLVAVFAHGVRLNLLEFSNHVGVEWGGWDYEPFKKK